MATETTTLPLDERLKHVSVLSQLMRRPELGAVAGLVLVTAFFIATADPVMFNLAGLVNFLTPAAQLGILALGAALLMIGGEFDLSIGSMVAFAGLVFGAAVTVLHLPFIVAVMLTLVVAGAIGMLNAVIVLRTGLPSFIVTLAFLFMLRGLSLVGLKWTTGGSTQMRGIGEAVQDSALVGLFSGKAFEGLFGWLGEHGLIPRFSNGEPMINGLPVEIVWFLIMTGIATWVLLRTPVGNWIFASGGDANAAKNSGVPVRNVKVGLFVLTALCAALVAIITVLGSGSTDARRGFQKEFEAIIAAVIGGCLLSGGYGSAIGAFLGSVIFGMVMIGLTYTRVDQDWYLVFLGGMLLVAVLFNNIIRRRVTGER